MTTETPTNGETPQAAPAAQPVEPVNPQPQQPAEPTEEAFDKDRAMNTIRNLREFEKQAKAQLKELETLKAEKAKREEAEMSETDRLRKQATEAQAQAAKLQADIWRRDVAAEAGIPSILVDRIQGATKDEMLADAKKLADALPKKTAPNIPATNPGNAQTGETPAQMRERLFGSQRNAFDMEAIRQQGGGVVWNDPNQ